MLNRVGQSKALQFLVSFAVMFALCLSPALVDAGILGRIRARREMRNPSQHAQACQVRIASSTSITTEPNVTMSVLPPSEPSITAQQPTPAEPQVGVAPEKYTVRSTSDGLLTVMACNGVSCRSIPVALERVAGNEDVFILIAKNAERKAAIEQLRGLFKADDSGPELPQ